MPIDTKLDRGLSRAFFLPLIAALNRGDSQRKCPVIDDLAWLMAGATRALAAVASGRDFLQSILEDVAAAWGRSTYFEALKSTRRLGLLRRINESICRLTMPAVLPDRLRAVPGLDKYDVYAGDGHWHEHATHDPRRGRKGGHGADKNQRTYVATGHVFGLNLRTRGIVHLAHCDEKTKIKEHDMGVLKRLDRDVLRQEAAKGRKVIWIWDPAGISYTQWYKWKSSAGIYFLSRPKDNMITCHVADLPWDKADPLNAGVERDGLLAEGPPTQIRLVVSVIRSVAICISSSPTSWTWRRASLHIYIECAGTSRRYSTASRTSSWKPRRGRKRPRPRACRRTSSAWRQIW